MLMDAIRWIFYALGSLLLLRALRGGFWGKYPVFYFYVFVILVLSILRFSVQLLNPDSYQIVFWGTEFLSVALGYAVIWEIYIQALKNYPGSAKIARCALSAILFLVIVRVAVPTLANPALPIAKTTVEFERLFRSIQAILLVLLLSLLVHYAIPIGKNLRGIILGYGVFLGASIINLTLRSHFGSTFQPWWEYLRPIASLVSLAIWSVTLWSYYPNPKPQTETKIERDYEFLAGWTAHTLAKVRAYLLGAVRP